VSFNTQELLRQTLLTLAEHSTGSLDLTVSVIDNGSSDGSADMVEAEFPHVKLLRSERNLGFGQANNVLLSRSRADYVLLLNSDVVVTEDILTPLLGELRSDPRIMLVGPRLVNVDGSSQYSANQFPTLSYEFARVIRGKRLGRMLSGIFNSDRLVRDTHESELTNRGVSRDSDFIWATCWLISRSDLPPDGIFDSRFPMYDEDLDFCRHVRTKGRLLRYVAEVELTHIGGASSASSARKVRLMTRARRRYYARHHGALTAAAYLLLIPLLSRLTMMIEWVPKPPRVSGRRL
jgi:GT2 family glycosyltransferase